MSRIGLVVVILSFICVQEILNAKIADILDAPYMAAVLYREEGKFRFRCNGAIISISHVLITATCLGDSYNRDSILSRDILVRVGSSFHYKGGRIHTVTGKRTHYNFSPDLDADIAVLTLYQPLKFSNRVAVVNLPKQDAVIHSSTDAVITYFRERKFSDEVFASSMEQITNFDITTIFACNSYFRTKPPLQDLVTENMICTRIEYSEPIVSPAAPLVFNGTVYGIFSWERMNSGSKGIFTRVSAFSRWIKHW